MQQTIVEQILSFHADRPVYSGEVVVVPIVGTMASDTTAPMAIAAFKEMGGQKVKNAKHCCLVIDHAAPAPNSRIANLHALIRRFALEQECQLYDVGQGIGHQLILENGHVKPGDILIGADSHTCTCGAIGALGIGVGSTDLAAVWRTGKIWLRVPGTIQIQLNGQLKPGVNGKDIILKILSQTGVSGANYLAMEFSGVAVSDLSLSNRMTMANMAVEAGAKTAFFHPNGLDIKHVPDVLKVNLQSPITPAITIDCSEVEPMISVPHSPALAQPVSNLRNKPVHYCFIGSCVNGRIEDLQDAARVLRGARLHPNTRMVICPASRSILMEAIKDGTMAVLIEAGATLIPPGCGPCVGTHEGVPGDGEVVISSANRNFRGRMGNPNAAVYLASAATVAASGREGRISDPRNFFN